MKAEDLIRVLEDHISKFGNTQVIMSKDGEGNGYSPLSSADQEMWIVDESCPWQGDIWAESDDPDWPDDPELDACPEEAVSCLLLWPMN